MIKHVLISVHMVKCSSAYIVITPLTWVYYSVNNYFSFLSLSLSHAVCVGMKCVLSALLVVVCVLGVDVGKAEASCPQDCRCTAAVVDCSSRGFTIATLPSSFPASTTELQLHDNHLTALPTGLLDGMQALQLVTLHGNPWECDCAVLYLRGWLLKQNNVALIRQVARTKSKCSESMLRLHGQSLSWWITSSCCMSF